MYSYYDFFCLLYQGVSVEAVDPVFQAKMLDMLKQTGRYVTVKRAGKNKCSAHCLEETAGFLQS